MSLEDPAVCEVCWEDPAIGEVPLEDPAICGVSWEDPAVGEVSLVFVEVPIASNEALTVSVDVPVWVDVLWKLWRFLLY